MEMLWHRVFHRRQVLGYGRGCLHCDRIRFARLWARCEETGGWVGAAQALREAHRGR